MLTAAVALVLLLDSPGVRAAGASPPPDLAALDRVEETSESFANALLDLSAAARRRDAPALAPFFASRLSALAMPVRPGPAAPERGRMTRHSWRIAAPAEASGADAVTAMQAFLRHFASIDGLRFDLPAFAPREGPADDGGDGRFALAISGRNASGRREGLRATGRIGGVRTGKSWMIDALAFEQASSLVAQRDLFTNVTERAGVAEKDPSFMERGGTALLAHGAAAGDVDGDGRIDVVSTGLARNALYLNQGDGRFREASAAAHLLAGERPGVAPLLLDHDNDGDQDVFVTTLGAQQLFENRLVPDGQLVFRDVSTAVHVDVGAWGFSATAGDVNGDGRPDIYVACYGNYGAVMPDRWDGAGNGAPNLLFVSRPDGTYREAAKELGVAGSAWSYAATFADLDGDGDLDLFVANDFGGPDNLYVNGGGRFVDEAAQRGLADPSYGMGVSVGDIDDDGRLDIHVTRMSSVAGRRVLDRLAPGSVPDASRLVALASGNGLYRSVGDGRFVNVSAQAGPFLAGWAWGGGFVDVDGDGHEDLFAPNGFASGAWTHDTESLFWREVVASKVEPAHATSGFVTKQVAKIREGFSFSGHQRDMLALNRGDGTFVDVSEASGIDDGGDGRAAVFADFDDDGDLDVFLRTMHDQAHVLYRNDVGQDSGWIRVALLGRASGRDAFGAVVRVGTSAGTLTKVKSGGSGFLSQADPRPVFGLGRDAAARWMEVTWPGGAKQRFPGPRAGTSLLLIEGEEAPRELSAPSRTRTTTRR